MMLNPRKYQFIGPYILPVAAPLSIQKIQSTVADYYGLPHDEMISSRRGNRSVTRPRQIAMYLAHALTPRSYPDLGRRFRRDHTTIMHGVSQIDRLLREDSEIASDVEELKKRLAA